MVVSPAGLRKNCLISHTLLLAFSRPREWVLPESQHSEAEAGPESAVSHMEILEGL